MTKKNDQNSSSDRQKNPDMWKTYDREYKKILAEIRQGR